MNTQHFFTAICILPYWPWLTNLEAAAVWAWRVMLLAEKGQIGGRLVGHRVGIAQGKYLAARLQCPSNAPAQDFQDKLGWVHAVDRPISSVQARALTVLATLGPCQLEANCQHLGQTAPQLHVSTCAQRLQDARPQC